MLAKLGAAAVLAGAAHAAPAVGACSAQSPPHTVALVELYTSEGCDSCASADRWLSSLFARGFTPGQIVPLALHLDYRDYVGWKDEEARLAIAAHRQKLLRLRRPAIVYSPQVVLQGRDFRGWNGDAFARRVAEINARPQRVKLALAIRAIGPGGAEVELAAELADAAPSDIVLYAAAYEDRRAGENDGEHDFVVQEWLGPISLGAGGRAAAKRTLPLLPDADPARSGVAAFAQNRRTAVVLQALMLPACVR